MISEECVTRSIANSKVEVSKLQPLYNDMIEARVFLFNQQKNALTPKEKRIFTLAVNALDKEISVIGHNLHMHKLNAGAIQ